MAQIFAGLEFEQIVRKYSSTVFSVCIMHLRNYTDAEDCFQNTFVKLYTKSPNISDETHLKSWLIRVAINECNNYIKNNKHTVSLESSKDIAVEFPHDENDISWALMKIPAKYRQVLYLHHAEQYKIEEIADILGKKPNTIKTMLKRGREKLKVIYGGDTNV